MPAPFVLLLLAIAAVWLPPWRVGARWHVAPWGAVYAVATGLALAQGYVGPVGVAALVALVVLAEVLRRQTRPSLGPSLGSSLGSSLSPALSPAHSPARRPALHRALYWLVFGALLVLAAALSLHAVPGFRNPVAMDAVKFSEDGRAFTQYLNFDKGSVGLVLLAMLAPRFQRGDAVLRTVGSTLLLTVAMAAAALGLATALGMIRWDPKWPPQTLQFLVTNLLLTCVAEEALFRWMVQDRLAFGSSDVVDASRVTGAASLSATGAANSPGSAGSAGPAATNVAHSPLLPEKTLAIAAHRWAWRPLTALFISALLFGAAHAGAGPSMIVVATVAGLGYAAAYQWHRRIEAAVLMHFGVNALHFVLFTYPLRA